MPRPALPENQRRQRVTVTLSPKLARALELLEARTDKSRSRLLDEVALLGLKPYVEALRSTPDDQEP